MTLIKALPIMSVGGLLGYLSPWGLNEAGFWLITIPICAAIGAIYGFLVA